VRGKADSLLAKIEACQQYQKATIFKRELESRNRPFSLFGFLNEDYHQIS
jgi:hypothetical protein